jgi:hypothetical protein
MRSERKSVAAVGFPGIEGMSFRPLPCFFVQPLDVRLQLTLVDPPLPPATHLYCRQLSGPNQGVGLGNTDVEVNGNVLIVLMTSALVLAVWAIAEPQLKSIVRSALDTVCGSRC